MKNHLLIAILLGILETCYGQPKILVLAGEGIAVYKDTILLGFDRPENVLSKIDTSLLISVENDTGMVGSFSIEMETRGDNYSDSSWAIYRSRITWSNTVIFDFEGTDPNSRVLKKITVLSPIAATTYSGLSIGDPFKKVTDTYQKAKRSYNYGANGFTHNYGKYSIYFHSEKVKQGNKPVTIISGFEIY